VVVVTAAVAVEEAVVEPLEFVAVTCTRTAAPTSVPASASVMSFPSVGEAAHPRAARPYRAAGAIC